MLISVLTFGTAGYVGIEGWSIFDALYMTVITVASVGFQEVHPLSAEGRAFTIALIIAGFGTVAYGLSAITAFWVEGDLLNVWESGKMERRVAGLRDHIVVCGGGDTGRHIARELLATRTPFVVIEIDRGQEEHLKRLGPEVIYVFGDATDAETLRQAGVGAARGLLACLPSDKDNLFALLSARELNPKIRIVSRVVDEASRGKLLRAGADAVVSSTSIGALRLASEMIRPTVVHVLDAMLREAGAVRVQEIVVGAAVAGQSLGALKLQERAGLIVFALREGASGRHTRSPSSGCRRATC
jgi:voltage-gated potassium channel